MSNRGIVRLKENDFVYISQLADPGCGDCTACSKGTVDGKFIKAFNDMNARVGDTVEFDMETKNIILAATLAYGLPLFMMVGSIVISNKAFVNMGLGDAAELYAILIGFATVALTYVSINLFERKIKDNKRFIAKIVKVSEKPKQEVFLNVKKDM